MTDAVQAVGVVVPAHDEEQLLPACLAALQRAAAAVPVPVSVVVVLDDCSDDTAAVAAAAHVPTLSVQARNVGVARAAGFAAVLRQFRGVAPHRLWLATTDADSVVPSGWLRAQLRLAADGAEVVAGTVTVQDWGDHPPHVAARYARAYVAREGHPHVHGANLAFSAAAYLDVGGMPQLPLAEDAAMLAALAHRRVVRTAADPVVTSSRSHGRARGGFADHLRELAV